MVTQGSRSTVRAVASSTLLVLVCVATIAVARPAAAANDYPWPSASPNSISPLRFYYRNCTDFVAWRLNQARGGTATSIKFDYSSLAFPGGDGNARGWKQGAINSGYAANATPAVGAVAWWGPTYAGSDGLGHVAVVSAVNADGTVNVEEYNNDVLHGYDTRTHVKADSYLHVKDTAPPPPAVWGGVGGAKFLGGSSLATGANVLRSQYLLSPDVQFVLTLQPDGNLVLFNGATARWSTGTSGTGATQAIMQSDGNLVLYTASGVAVWSSRSSGHPGSHLDVQTDGNVVIRQGDTPVWSSGVTFPNHRVAFGSNQLQGGQRLTADQYIRSADKRFALLMQADGNLVVYAPGGRALWASRTNGKGLARADQQTDGNLVLYDYHGTAIWNAKTYGFPGALLSLENNGDAMVRQGTTIRWDTKTGGKL